MEARADSPRSASVRAVLSEATAYLAAHGSTTPRLDAELLLAQARGCDRLRIYLDADACLADAECRLFRSLLARRARGEPVAYLRGEREFWSRPFAADHRVLVPRPESELLVDTVLRLLSGPPSVPRRILDVGTGSGNIAVTLAAELPGARVVGTDRSGAALTVAASNARRHGVADRVAWVRGDLLGMIAPRPAFDAVVTNLPYVPADELERASPEVARWEPRMALDGGRDGLEIIRRALPAAVGRLVPRGVLVVEVGAGQAGEVLAHGVSLGLDPAGIEPDPAGIERVVWGRRST